MKKNEMTKNEIDKLVSKEMQLVGDLYKQIRIKSKSFDETVARMEMAEICLRMLVGELKERGTQKGIYSEA